MPSFGFDLQFFVWRLLNALCVTAPLTTHELPVFDTSPPVEAREGGQRCIVADEFDVRVSSAGGTLWVRLRERPPLN